MGGRPRMSSGTSGRGSIAVGLLVWLGACAVLGKRTVSPVLLAGPPPSRATQPGPIWGIALGTVLGVL